MRTPHRLGRWGVRTLSELPSCGRPLKEASKKVPHSHAFPQACIPSIPASFRAAWGFVWTKDTPSPHAPSAGTDPPPPPAGAGSPLPQPLHIPAQGGRVAGDVHHPLGAIWTMASTTSGEILPEAGPRRSRRGGAPGGQLPLGGLAGVGAEKLRILHPVAPGIGLGVLHCGGGSPPPDGPPCLAGHHQGDGADAAVEVHHRLPPGETGKGQSPAIEDLRLLPGSPRKGDRQAGTPARTGVSSR